MAWSIKRTEDGRWEWSCFQSAYGAASGTADTLAAAKVELAIAESAVMEHPYPPQVVAVMREDPERFATDLPDPVLNRPPPTSV